MRERATTTLYPIASALVPLRKGSVSSRVGEAKGGRYWPYYQASEVSEPLEKCLMMSSQAVASRHSNHDHNYLPPFIEPWADSEERLVAVKPAWTYSRTTTISRFFTAL